MVFPTSDNLMIQDELIEYLPEHPLHVRIKGVDHPVLKFCCVKDTGYVATSALKNFHPASYGIMGIVFLLVFQHVLLSILSPLSFDFKNNNTSPALTFHYFPQSFSEQLQELKDSQNLETAKREIKRSQNRRYTSNKAKSPG